MRKMFLAKVKSLILTVVILCGMLTFPSVQAAGNTSIVPTPDFDVYVNNLFVRVFDNNKLINGTPWVAAEAMANDFRAIYYPLLDGSGFVLKNDLYEMTALYGESTVTVRKILTNHKVVYDLNGGSGAVPEETDKLEDEVFTAATLDMGVTPPTAGYVFTEWNTKEDGSGDSYLPDDPITMGARDLTLYAIWEIGAGPTAYTVTYSTYGGSGTAPTENPKMENEPFPAKPNTFTAPAGKMFAGWHTDHEYDPNDPSELIKPGDQITMPGHALVLYAIWMDIPEQTGAEGSPWLVANETDLRKVGTGVDGWNLNSHYKMIANIDMASSATVPFTKIGTGPVANAFSGVFDGQGYVISNLTINGGATITGLFGYVESAGNVSAIVRNVGLNNATITGGDGTGGIAGIVRHKDNNPAAGSASTIIENCYVINSSINGTNRVGGVIGNAGQLSVLRNSYSNATVQNTTTTGAGGVAGSTPSGGNSTFENNYFAGTVNATGRVGGIIANSTTANNIIRNNVVLSAKIADATNPTNIGRIDGYGTTPVATLANNYSYSGTTIRNTNTLPTTGVTATGVNGADVSAEVLKTKSFWTGTLGWDFENVWEWDDSGVNAPKLKDASLAIPWPEHLDNAGEDQVLPRPTKTITINTDPAFLREISLTDGPLSYIPLETLSKAFDADYLWNPVTKRADVTILDPERFDVTRFPLAEPGQITVKPLSRDASYFIPHTDEDAVVSVWWRSKDSEMYYSQQLQQRNTGYAWYPAPQPRFVENGADFGFASGTGFVGSLGHLNEGVTEVILVRVESGGSVTEFRAEPKMRSGPNNRGVSSYGEGAYNDIIPLAETAAAGGMLLRSTFENISVYVNKTFTSTNPYTVPGVSSTLNIPVDTSHTLEYKETSSSVWLPALDMMYDPVAKQFRGSIVNLKPNTSYDVRVNVQGEVKERTISTWTETDDLPIAETLYIEDMGYTPGKPLTIAGIKGSPTGWIEIKSRDNTVVEVTEEFWQAVHIGASEYVILKDLTIRGGRNHAVDVVSSASNIRIVNCDISAWGRLGTLYLGPRQQTDDGGRNIVDRRTGWRLDANVRVIANNAGIHIGDANFIDVERNYMHDPVTKSTSWDAYGVRDFIPGWNSIHSSGALGMFLRGGQGIVIRYNDFIGSDDRRWDDAIGTYQNSAVAGGIGTDSDVYGNWFAFMQDDSTELEGSGMNVRYYGNKVEGFYNGVSLASEQVGPAYLFNNTFTNAGDEWGVAIGGFKSGIERNNWTRSRSMEFVINNTMHMPKGGSPGRPGDTFYKPYYRNNIIESSEPNTANLVGLRHDYVYPGVSYDNNLVYGSVNLNLAEGEPKNDNGYMGKANFTDSNGGNFTLAQGSLGIDDGVVVPNFTKGYNGLAPDVGALEYGGDNLIPFRPITLRSVSYQVYVPGNTTVEYIVQVGDVAPGTTYEIIKNSHSTWFDVVDSDGNTSGALTKNGQLVLSVTGNQEDIPLDFQGFQYPEGKGGFIIKQSDGQSLPVTVFVKNQLEVPAGGIALDKATANIEVGQSLVLNATVTPFNATTPIVWSSNSETVATAENGRVMARAPGIAVITVSAGSHSASCVVTVSDQGVLLFTDYLYRQNGGRLQFEYNVPDGTLSSGSSWNTRTNEMLVAQRDGFNDNRTFRVWRTAQMNEGQSSTIIETDDEFQATVTARYGGITEKWHSWYQIHTNETGALLAAPYGGTFLRQEFELEYADLFVTPVTHEVVGNEFVIHFTTPNVQTASNVNKGFPPDGEYATLSQITPQYQISINGAAVDPQSITYSHDVVNGTGESATRSGQIRVQLPPGGLQTTDVLEYALYPAYDASAEIKYTFSQEPVVGFYTPGAAAEYSVIIRQTDGGTISTDRNKAASGQQVTITVTPDQLSSLIPGTLKVNGGTVPVSADNKFTMPNGPAIITAEFAREMYNINITQYAEGSITASKIRGGAGDEISLNVTSNTGYVYVPGSLKVTGSSGDIPLGADNSFIMPSENVTVTAQFVRLYNVNVIQSQNGTISVNKTRASEGESVTVAVYPNASYRLIADSVSVNSGVVPVIADARFEMPNTSVTVTALFEQIPADEFLVSVVQSEGGLISVDKQSAAQGETVTITVIQDSMYSLVADSLTINN